MSVWLANGGMMKISYLTSFPFFRLPNGALSSAGASARYRILLPAGGLTKLGHQIGIVTASDAVLKNPRESAARIDADVIVVSKFFDPRVLNLVEELKRRKVNVIADYCDNHFLNQKLVVSYLRLAETADRIVCNSAEMAKEIARRAGREASVICDPVEGRKNPPRFAPNGSEIECVSYGYPLGIQFLFQKLKVWIGRGFNQKVRINAITELVPELVAEAQSIRHMSDGRCEIHLTPWSYGAVQSAIRSADLVLLPSDSNPMTITKSANRLIEAIYGGRLAIASGLPSYMEFSSYYILDSNFPAVKDAFDGVMDANQTIKMISEGQAYIESRYLPEHAAIEWNKIFQN